ncbi:hypothetical protein QVD17_27618 [Tagetes erecta]|uniref:Phytocyanin domain-containing protein n=1 Tax=Tagetes erecta TaxID=13708 RepID=A0AAD8NRS3_TARER|nr:hypothetical protein QVD17_27618 [Tagetes erecta]
MAASKLMMVIVVIAIASFRLPSTVAQTRHVVGDTFGWRVPTDANSNYTTWASGKTFRVGDTLVFNFATGAHDVAEVTEAAYGPCNLANPIILITTGPADVVLNATGNHYYVCTIGPHCNLGQKFSINVVAASTNPPTTGAPAPSGTTTPPPPSSGAISFTGVVPATLLVAAAALALLY